MGGIMDQTNNCFTCNKKLTLVDIYTNKCKCEHVFCKKHKEASKHKCSYSYFNENSNILKKTLISVTSQKVIKI